MISTPNQMAFDFEDTQNKLSWNISLKFGGRRLLLGRVILSSAIAASSAMTFAANKPAVHLSKQDSEIQKFKDCTINLRLSHDKKKIIGDGIAIPIPNGAIISDDNLYASIRVRGKFLGFQMEKILIPSYADADRRPHLDVFDLQLAAPVGSVRRTLESAWKIRFKKSAPEGRMKIVFRNQGIAIEGGGHTPSLALMSPSVGDKLSHLDCSHTLIEEK